MKLVCVNHPCGWNRFVSEHPHAAYGHLFEWSNAIQAAYGHAPLYLAAVDGNGKDRIRAVLPLFKIKRPFFNPEWVSIPFFDQAGILARDHEAGRWLVEKTGSLLASKGSGRLSLRQDCRFSCPDLALGGRRPLVYDEKVGMQIPLAPNAKEMMARFPSKLRSQIRKGMKNGLAWDIGKERLLAPFYRVFSRNMRDLGSPVHSRRFFKAVFHAFPSRAFICVVYYRGEPCAAAFMLRFKNRLANPWASSLREYRHLNTNMLLYWQMIRFACNLGLDRFDMGRSSRGASTHKFKQQWGPSEAPLAWYSWPLNETKTVKETLSIAPWRKLPVWGANLAGPLIRKYISL
ncbi:MAG: GNAT family N-acetyltransferase [Desulfobacter sp.]|nr:MAG: GNAT family N-acetyltransferase [Desulfobacter sp.]